MKKGKTLWTKSNSNWSWFRAKSKQWTLVVQLMYRYYLPFVFSASLYPFTCEFLYAERFFCPKAMRNQRKQHFLPKLSQTVSSCLLLNGQILLFQRTVNALSKKIILNSYVVKSRDVATVVIKLKLSEQGKSCQV